jgi:hypothetical protein
MVRGVSRAVVAGEWWPSDAWMRRRVTPASRRGVAQAWRRVGTDARFGRPRALRAARKASGPRALGRGGGAVDRPAPARPGAGKIQTGWRGGLQEERRRGQGRGGRGPSRSLPPLPWRTWTHMRAASRALTGRGVPSGRRRPQASRVDRQTRSRGRRTPARLVRTAAGLRRTGRFFARGGLTQARVVQARGQVWA